MRPAFAVLVLVAASGCSIGAGGNSPAALESIATTNVTCTAISADCAQQYINRASACAQRNDSIDAQHNTGPRQCAVQNFQEAERHAPAGSSEATRTNALIGLADALKTTSENAPDAQSANDAQVQLEQALSRLDQQAGGHVYVLYYTADRLVAQSNDRNMPDAVACQQLSQARADLPAGQLSENLAQRVTMLRNTLEFQFQRRRCT
jgi:hypothetical protein